MKSLRIVSGLLSGLLTLVIANGGCGRYGNPVRQAERKPTAERTADASTSPEEEERTRRTGQDE